MIGWLLTGLVAATIQEAGPAVPIIPRLVEPARISRCMRPLQHETIDRRVIVRCRVGAAGRLGGCEAPDAPDLTPVQRTAAVCLAGGYGVDESLEGDSVNIPVRLRMMTRFPPGVTPPRP